MTRTVYVNGRYLPYAEAAIHPEDRGNQFADAVYEVIEVREGHLIDETRHLARLERSLGAITIPKPMSRAAWARVLRETIRRNRVRNGLVYLQVSRGVAKRDFFYPAADTLPTVICLARRSSRAKGEAQAEKGIAIQSTPDIRWANCDIKTVMLLPASMAKQRAKESGANDAWFVDAEGYVTEGASANVWIVDREGKLVTRALDKAVLPGITRATLLDVLAREGIPVVERPFTIEEAQSAREAFITSATSIVMPVTSIDGRPVGNGSPGMLALRLRAEFHKVAERAPA
ncbi:MAG TPA: D-amino-acid transaminase [Hyphomicrobiaceae bacterium]|nr:D-amino-acid transaminase [Hyphomicrobiaceae bacterium]